MSKIIQTDTEPVDNGKKKIKIANTLKKVGNGVVATTMALGIISGSASPVEGMGRTKNLTELSVKKEHGEGYIEVSTTSISKGFGEIDGKPQGAFFYLLGYPKPLNGDLTKGYELDPEKDKSFGKGENIMCKVIPVIDTEGTRLIRVVFDNETHEKFVPGTYIVETQGGGVATITTINEPDLWFIDIIPNSPKGETSTYNEIEKGVTRTVGHPVDYVLVTVIDPKTKAEIQWKTEIIEKQTPPDIN